ncbi:hypothetical protein V8E36_005353 [Tilletia maclaganii]
MTVTVGVLALQGAFREHASHIGLLASSASAYSIPSGSDTTSSTSHTAAAAAGPLDVQSILVRTPAELAQCDALIIPGGESTAIALGAQRSGLMEPLRSWVAAGKPTWGTCAGMIMLSNQAIGAKRGGQSLIGGVDIRVGRNGFGSQVDSFEAGLEVPALGPEPFPGVFIRAPVIDALLLLPTGEPETGSSSTAPAVPGINGAAVPVPRSVSDLPPQPVEASELATAVTNGHKPSEVAPVVVYAEPPSTPIFELTQGQAALTQRPALEIIATIPFSPVAPPKDHVQLPHSSASAASADNVKTLSVEANKVPYQSAAALLNPENRPERDSQIVALRQGNIMVTSFHPELTVDSRFHEYFVRSIVLQ